MMPKKLGVNFAFHCEDDFKPGSFADLLKCGREFVSEVEIDLVSYMKLFLFLCEDEE